MRHPHYDRDGKLLGHYADEQHDRNGKLYTSPPIPDDHPHLLAWEAARKPDTNHKGKLELLEDRVAELEKKLAKLRG